MTKEPSTRLSHYIWIPGATIRIARDQSYNGLDWQETRNVAARDSNQFMPPLPEFMHFYNCIIAAEREGRTLYDGSNKPLTRKEVNELYERFVLGKQDGAWTHLDAHFIKGSGFNKLDVSTHYRVRHDGTSRIVTHRESPLEECVAKSALVELAFNEQGLPTRKSKINEYQPRTNIHFWPPKEDAVAGFGANSGRSGFNCDRDLRDSGASLGVFVCAEGAPRRTK